MRHPFLAGSSLGKHRTTHSAVSARYYCSIVLALLGRWMLLRLYDITLGPRFDLRFRITYWYSTVPYLCKCCIIRTVQYFQSCRNLAQNDL